MERGNKQEKKVIFNDKKKKNLENVLCISALSCKF